MGNFKITLQGCYIAELKYIIIYSESFYQQPNVSIYNVKLSQKLLRLLLLLLYCFQDFILTAILKFALQIKTLYVVVVVVCAFQNI